MSEYTMKKVEGIIAVVGFVVCIWLIIDGQKDISWFSLGQMIFGLAGLLVLLYFYNKGFVDKRKKDKQ